ncbi:MAG TPA: tetratricopeptide repeat protein [Myxococcota bacterium]|nr:tetratricopeptide repeat protein [Myxococcota bacterium]
MTDNRDNPDGPEEQDAIATGNGDAVHDDGDAAQENMEHEFFAHDQESAPEEDAGEPAREGDDIPEGEEAGEPPEIEASQAESPAIAARIDVQLVSGAGGNTLPIPGGPGSHPAPFDPRQAPAWQALLAEYEREIAVIGEVPAAATLYYESGKIWEEKLAQPRNAWNCYNKAFQLRPGLIPNIRAAGRLASQVGNWNVAVQIIESEIEAISDMREKAFLYHRRGLILEEKLGKIEEAGQAYQAGIDLASDNIELLKQKERLAISAADWQTVLQVRLRILEMIDDPPVAMQILLGCARIQRINFDNDREAEKLYRRVLESDPQNILALDALQEHYAKFGPVEMLLEVVEKQAAVTPDPPSAVWLLYRAARLLRERIGDEDRAIETLSRALVLSPGNHMLLAEMAAIYENLMRWQELVGTYEQMVEVISDRQEKVSIYFKLGSIWEEKLFNEDQAIANYRKVVELSPNYLPALQALGKLFYRKGQWDDLVRMYEVEIRETEDAKQKAVKLYKLAEILSERLSRDEDAIGKLEQCLEFSPGYLPALKTLGNLYSKYNRWESLIHMYERELDVTRDHDQSIFLLDKIGSLWEEKLNNIDQAIETYKRLLEISPNYLPAIRTLGKLFVRADKWEEMIQINELEAQLINDQKQVVSLLHRNGEIYEEKLNDKDKAIETYKKVLALSPAYLPALQSLGRLYFIKGRWDDLIAMHRQEIEVTLNEDKQITLLYKIGELYEEKLVQEDKAVVVYQEVLRIKDTNFPAMKALIRIYTNKRDWENLIAIHEKEATVLDDPRQKALSLFRVAEIYENHLSLPEKATEVLQNLLQIVSDDTPAIRSLGRLYTAAEDWRGLLSIYELEIKNASSESRRAQIYGRMADVYASRVNDLVRATECYENILAIKPDHLQSFEALERIYISQRNYTALARIYEASSRHSSDPRLRLAFQSQIADLKENRLQPPQNAGENHLKMIEIDPTHPDAIRSLDILYHKFGTWNGLRLLYERELTRTRSEDEAADLCLRIADLAENRLDSIDVAAHYYQEALRLRPDHLPAIKALKRIKQAQGDQQAVIGLLDREGSVTRDPAQAIATLLQAAQIYIESFDDPARAAECLFKVLERDPEEVQAFGRLEALLIKQADWERLSILYRNRIGVTADNRALAELHIKLAGLYREQLGRPQDAAKSLGEVIEINPSHVQSIATLSELTFENEQWDETIRLCDRLQELTTDAALLAACHFRLGVVYQEKKTDLDRAVSHFGKVLETNKGDIPTLERLKAIHVARQQWGEAEVVLARLVEVNGEPANRLKYLMEQAGIYESGIADPEKAVESYRQIQNLDPNNVDIIQKLGDLYEKLERWQDLVDAYHAFIRLLPPDREQEAVPLHLKIGGIFADQLDNMDKAIIEYKRVTEINPRHVEAHEALARLYGSTGLYYANAVDEHRRLLEINPFRVSSYHELRRIFEEQRVFDKVLGVCSVLHYLRAADQNEEFFYGENKSKVPDRSAERLTFEEIENQITHPGEKGVLREILKLVGQHLSKAYAPNLERHGVGKGDRARPDDPMRTLTNGIVSNLGEIEFELYHSTQPTHLVAIENTSPPALIVGEGLLKRTVVKEQRFALARAVKRVSDGGFLAAVLGPRELSRLIAALVQPYHPNCPVATYPADLPADLPKRLAKVLPRKIRRALEELMSSQAPDLARVPDYESFVRDTEYSANHFGLLMCNDVSQAIMHLIREVPELRNKRLNTSEEIAGALSQSGAVADLLRFAVSEEYFRLRARMKFSIVS